MPCSIAAWRSDAHLDPVAPPGRNAAQDLGADRRGLLAARIVVGHQREVGQARGDLAHHRPLGRGRGRRRSRTPRPACPWRTAAGSPAPSPAPRACGRSRHRPARRSCDAPRAAAGPARRSGSPAPPPHARIAARRDRRGQAPPARWRPGSRRPAAARPRGAAEHFDDEMLAARRRLVAHQPEFLALGAVGPESDAAPARKSRRAAPARSLSALTTAVPPSGSSARTGAPWRRNTHPSTA